MRTIARNTVFLTGSELLAMALQFLFVIVLTKHYGHIGFGKISFAISFAMVASILGDAGLNTLIIRKIAQNEEGVEGIISNALAVKIAVSVVVVLLSILLLWVSKAEYEKIVLVGIITTAFVLGTMAQLFRNVFQAYEKMEYEAIVKTIHTVLYISLGILAVVFQFDIVFIGLAYLVGSFFNLILSMRICFNKFSRFSIKFDFHKIAELMVDAYPFAVSAVIASFFFNMDILMLGYFKGDEAVGWYSLAYRIMTVVIIFPQFFVQAIFPRLCKFSSSAKESLYFALEKGMKYMFLIALPMALLITHAAGPVISAVFGENFTNSILALQILIWCAATIFISMILTVTVNAMNKQKQNMFIFSFNALLNFFLNLLLIPKYSLYGAAVATLITHIHGVFWTSRLIPNFGFYLKRVRAEKIIVAGVFMEGTLLFFNDNLLVAAIISIGVYLAACFMFKTFEKEEMELMKEIIIKPNPK